MPLDVRYMDRTSARAPRIGLAVAVLHFLKIGQHVAPQTLRRRRAQSKGPSAQIREGDGWLAVAVGFEPTDGLHRHTLSRRAPSAARTRYRREAYKTAGAGMQAAGASQ